MLDLAADHLDAAFDRLLVAGAFDDRRVLGVDLDLLGPAQVVELDALELDAQVLEDRLAAGQDGDVFEHGLAAIAVARGLDRADLEDAPELVDDQGRQGLAFDVLGDDEQRLFLLGDRFQQRDQVLGGADLLLVDEDVRVLELDDHRVPGW